LRYFTPNGDKVTLISGEKELVKLEFENGHPRRMKFRLHERTAANLPGLGWITIETQSYQRADDQITLKYQLWQQDLLIGTYHLVLYYEI
jgi:hypothetical protein